MGELFPESYSYELGQKVRVNQERGGWRVDWGGVYVVVAIKWDFIRGDKTRVDFTIASEDEIKKGFGGADGFSVLDLRAA